MKKLNAIILALLILLTNFSYGPYKTAEGAGDASDNDSKPYRTGAWFEDGKLIFVTPNKKASASVRYGSKAFIIRADTTCDKLTTPNSKYKSLVESQCGPLTGGPDRYLRFDLYNSNGKKNDEEWNFPTKDPDECEYVKQQNVSMPDCDRNIVVSRFEIDKDTFADKLVEKDIFKNLRDGQTVYLNTVFRVINDSRYGEFTTEFTQLHNNNQGYGNTDYNGRGIYEAANWTNASYFRNYYDVPVEFKGSYPIYVQYLHEDTRQSLKSQKEIINTKPNPDYESGKWPAWKYVKADTPNGEGILLDKTITSNGKTYVLKCSYITRVKKPETKGCSDSGDDPYWVRDGSLLERNPAVYVGGTYVIALYNEVTCECEQAAVILDKPDVEGVVTGSVIGKKVPMQINMKQTPASLDKWKEWVKDKTDIRLVIRLWRSDNADINPNNNTGERAIWEKVGNAPNPQTDPSIPVEVSVSANELIAYLSGQKKVIYNDNLINYPIPPDGIVSFRYNASVSVLAKQGTAEISITCDAADSTILTWTRPPEEEPDVGYFKSTPKYFSEIKQGSPQTAGTGSNEQFEAMAGTPTTHSLYFASGGSEFIVDVEVEYVPKVTQTRTYTSRFNAVVNGWAMEKIEGSYQKDSPPPAPSPRTKVDECGVSFTEQVVPKSRPYLKGYTSGENPQPIYGTEYGWDQLGYSSHLVGGYVDTWTQTVTFDYMKINKAVVWKLDKSKVNGMATLVGTNEVTATITQGDPNIFYNIAQANTSAAGRLRYSLETEQHDSVLWIEGNSDNCLSNSKDGGKVKEQDTFNKRRAMEVNATAISDFLILQTSSGDQSVLYFEKPSNTAKTTEDLIVPESDFDQMWTNNALSAAKWDQLDTIKVGSYNGNFMNPASKYSGSSTGIVSTIFDSKPAGLHRPARPSPYMRLMATNLDVPDTLPNGEYKTGIANVFYKVMLNYNPDRKTVAYSTGLDPLFGANGQSFASPYSSMHQKVNDVVIHNPVSVENAMVLSLPDELDQRTPQFKEIGGNKQEGITEFERILDPDYRQNVIPNGDAEIVNANKTVAGWHTWIDSGTASSMTFTSRSGDPYVIGGTSSFEVNSRLDTPVTGGYWLDVKVKPNTNYQFDGDIACHRCIGYFVLNFYDSNKQAVPGSYGGTTDAVTSYTAIHKSYAFKTPATAAYVRVHLIKGNGIPTIGSTHDYLFADNLSLKNMDEQEFIAVDPVYVTEVVPNPDYVPPQTLPGITQTFNYTGAEQQFVAPYDGTYTLELWGAAGGISSHATTRTGTGGYAKGEIDLKAGDVLYIYVGGKGQDYGGGGGWNGGGSGYNNSSDSAGGGGATDIRFGGRTLNHRIIVAGGGGGNGCSADFGGAGGGLVGQDGVGNNYLSPGKGGTQTAGGQSGGGGSSYVGGVKNGVTYTSGNAGHGYVKITAPEVTLPAKGSPTMVVSTLAGGSDGTIPSDAYKLVPKTTDPNKSDGEYSPGNFVLLDYAFTLYFPNTGDFQGNGAWGLAETTDLRGKGFVDNMDTTIWTRAKYVKFDFNVIYNNQMYLANEWIPLDVPTTHFEFYVPLANREKISALVEYKSIAINAPHGEDNDAPTNRVRYDSPRPHAAKHSTLKKFNVDVVGRIGNMVIEDTGDFRFSNLFKKSLSDWLIPNVVHRVNINEQNEFVGDEVDIRGVATSPGTRYLNTWGMLTHLQKEPIPFPLSPEKNNIPALQRQPMRIGYDVLSSIQTMGNYYNRLQVIPYYYHLNLQTGEITEVDMYMLVDGVYKPINRHSGTIDGADIHPNPVWLDWDAEAGRRNVFNAERELTEQIAGLFATSGGDSATGKAAVPSDKYLYGTSQSMLLTGRNRTYIGEETTYGVNKNPGNRLSGLEYGMQAQRWHFSYSLPSSAVAVPQNAQPTQANIDRFKNNTSVLILAADIYAIGDTYALRYQKSNEKARVAIDNTSWSLASIPYPVIAVYSAMHSSADDLSVTGTH